LTELVEARFHTQARLLDEWVGGGSELAQVFESTRGEFGAVEDVLASTAPRRERHVAETGLRETVRDEQQVERVRSKATSRRSMVATAPRRVPALRRHRTVGENESRDGKTRRHRAGPPSCDRTDREPTIAVTVTAR